MKEGLCDFGFDCLDIFDNESGIERPYAAGDIKAHTPCRYHAAFFRIKRRDPADGESITPVSIGHGVGCLDDAGQ